MRVDEFLESNMIRSFPFVDTYGSPVPDWLIVDFRATILAGTFDPSIHSVYLAWMARLSNKVRFGFRTDAPELADQELIFELDMSSDKMVTQHVYSQPLTKTMAERCGCSEEMLCDPVIACGAQLLCNSTFTDVCGNNLMNNCTP
jgi:hypothetical protein